MIRFCCAALAVVCLWTMSGCRCTRALDRYGDAIDEMNDCQVLWDSYYCPRCDVSRAGKPDWCGPLNRRVCPCRCQNGCYTRHDACWQYPPSHPYVYPSQSLVPGDVGQPPNLPADSRPPEPPYESPAAPGPNGSTAPLVPPSPPAAGSPLESAAPAPLPTPVPADDAIPNRSVRPKVDVPPPPEVPESPAAAVDPRPSTSRLSAELRPLLEP
jgi:hypothetical protein